MNDLTIESNFNYRVCRVVINLPLRFFIEWNPIRLRLPTKTERLAEKRRSADNFHINSKDGFHVNQATRKTSEEQYALLFSCQKLDGL